MRNSKADRRSERTRQLLSEALVALMLETPYDSITVQAIIDRANVGRSTFYAHYQDKEDLLLSNFARLVDQLSRQVEASDRTMTLIIPCVELFRHVQGHYGLYKALVWGRGMDLVFKGVQTYLSQTVERQLEAHPSKGQKPSVPLPVIASFAVGALLALLKWWLDNNLAYTPEQMDAMFQQLVVPGVQDALGIGGNQGSGMR